MPDSLLPPRYCEKPFPPYRYIPGQAPHPLRDPGGHSRGQAAEPLESFDPAGWRSCQSYLYGIDLFNYGFWWEAHEALETCWVAAGRTTVAGLFLQGLIQIAVACLKQYQGFTDVAARMALEGLTKFPRGEAQCLGIELAALRREVTDYFSGGCHKPPQITLDSPAGGAGGKS